KFGTGHRNLMLLGDSINTDFEELAGVGCAVRTPRLLQIRRTLSTRVRMRGKVYGSVLDSCEFALRPLYAGHAALIAARLRGQGVDRFGAPNEGLPCPGIRVSYV